MPIVNDPRLASSYANPASPAALQPRPAIPLAIGTHHFKTAHEVCTTSYAALTDYLGTLPYPTTAHHKGPCRHHAERTHYWVEPCP